MVGENRVSLSHIDHMSRLGVVHLLCHVVCPAQHHMSAIWVLRENLIFSLLLLHNFNCTRQLHESLSSVAGVQVRGRSHRESALLETNSNA
jgi:hypothetical protein